MIRTALAATALLLAAVPAAAQNQQEALAARYDRALAAGYKALMLCGAIANAEANGTVRTPDSVTQWELTGIQAPLDAIVPNLPHEVVWAQPFADGNEPPYGELSLEEVLGADDLSEEEEREIRAAFAAYVPSRPVFSHVAVTWAEDMPPRWASYRPGKGCLLAPIGLKVMTGDVVVADPPTVASRPRVAATQRQAALDPVLRMALGSDYGEGSRTTALLVLRDGEPISEAYQSGFDPATPQRTWSVAKSIAATLVGAAVHKQQIDVNAPGVHDAWLVDARNAITIDHLLRMASGRYSDTPGNRTDPLYWGGSTVEESAAIWPLIHQPGTVFRYANNDTLMAVKAVSDMIEDFDPAAFFKALGMTGSVAETDWHSDYILSSQVWTTARDLAKLGQLYLNDGKLPSGERILPEGWVKYVTTPSGPQPPNGFGYGAGFWLLNREEGVPPDTFAALGNRGQHVVIVPSRKVVIVRRGEDPVGAGFDIAAFTRDVLAALPAE